MVNEKSEKIEADAKSFKDIVMAQINNIGESLTSVIDLINSANDTISQTGEKVQNDAQLSELVSNLPKGEVVDVDTTSTVDEVQEVSQVDDIDTIQPAEVVETVEPIETLETYTEDKKIVDLDNLDDLSEYILPPKNVDNDVLEVETPTSKSSEFSMEGLDDLLKAVEETAEDEEIIEEFPTEPTNNDSASSMDELEDLIKQVEATTTDDMEAI